MKAVHIFNRGEEPISKLGEEPKIEIKDDHMLPNCKGEPVLFTGYSEDGKIPDGRIARRCSKCGAFTYEGKKVAPKKGESKS